MSLASLLSIARSALVTHQQALDTTSHNIANVNTPGYSRQRLGLTADEPLRTPWGGVGRGVTGEGIFGARDNFLDASFRRETGVQGHATTLGEMLGRVEEVFGEPSATGISASLDAFYDAFSDLSNDPSSVPARTLVQQTARALARRFHEADTQLVQLEGEVAQRLQAQVGEINSITTQLGELNRRIVADGGPLHSAPDLEDQRSILIDKLATMGGVRVLDRNDGSVGVLLGDTLLVDGAHAQTLEVRSIPAGGFGVAVAGNISTLNPGGGSLGALTELSTTKIPAVKSDLDRLVAAFVGQVNATHQTGFTTANVTGTNFFDPAGVTARTIALDAAIDANPAAIAAGATINPGDGAIALSIAGLRTATLGPLGTSANEFYIGLVSGVAGQVQDATREGDAAAVLVGNAEARRASVSGVSLDEEMLTLITQQQAYTAATRIVQIADEMMDDLLNMI